MKKLIVIVALMLGIAVAASAQPRALGLRGGGWVSELSYQHSLGENFIEADLGWWYSGGVNIAAAYDFSIAPLGPFNFYAGPAAELYTYNYVNGDGNNAMGLQVGVGAQIGLEYDFLTDLDVPLVLSLDLRPMAHFYLLGHYEPAVDYYKYFGWGVALGVRYIFH